MFSSARARVHRRPLGRGSLFAAALAGLALAGASGCGPKNVARLHGRVARRLGLGLSGSRGRGGFALPGGHRERRRDGRDLGLRHSLASAFPEPHAGGPRRGLQSSRTARVSREILPGWLDCFGLLSQRGDGAQAHPDRRTRGRADQRRSGAGDLAIRQFQDPDPQAAQVHAAQSGFGIRTQRR